MTYHLLDAVVLTRDVPESGLKACDLGTVVELYSPAGLPAGVEVEFVTAAGKTRAVVTLSAEDIRPVRDDDLMAVRSQHPVK